MRFLVVGAGGIGCYYGARLQQAGHQVVYVARGEHLQALQHKGLSVEHEDFTFHGSVEALDEAALQQQYQVNDFDLLLICFKSQATQPWLSRFADWLQQGSTPLLSLQNGVDNEPELEAAVGRARTLGGIALRIGGHIEAPGVITASGPAQIIFGAWPDQAQNTLAAETLQKFDAAFIEAGIPSRISENIAVELWRKLMLNNAVNPLSALTHLDTQTLSNHELYGPVVRQLMQEVAAIAAAEGLPIGEQDVAEMYALICAFDGIKTSMLVDLEKGRPLELEGISGTLLKRGKKLQVPTPMTGLVYGLLNQQHETH